MYIYFYDLQFSEKVNLHFLGLMEALRECNSSVLAKVTMLYLIKLSDHN